DRASRRTRPLSSRMAAAYRVASTPTGRRMSIGARLLSISDADNVAVALTPIPAGSPVPGGAAVSMDIPAGHKVAARRIAKGDPVLKFGQSIGVASEDIGAGEHVHVHNVTFAGRADRAASGRSTNVETNREAWFDGYVRGDGRVGTRN